MENTISVKNLKMVYEYYEKQEGLKGSLKNWFSKKRLYKVALEDINIQIQKGSIVELISGPFKGERAKVVRIDESREEVVLELIEAAVPIPVTVKADQIRIIQKEAD